MLAQWASEGERANHEMGQRGLRLAGLGLLVLALSFAAAGCAKKTKSVTTTSASADEETPLAAGFRSHIVGPRETLYRLATIYYGDGRQWQKIYYANKNRIADPADLPVGIRLIIPPREDPTPAH